MSISFLTTHVGSLPFLSIQEGMDYTFQFDIPVLFTLPKRDICEDMIGFIVDKLNLGSYEKETFSIKLKENYLDSTLFIRPSYEENFFQRLEMEEKKYSSFKYQLAGPYTLWKLVENKNEHSRKEFFHFILEKYRNLLSHLRLYGEFIFMLDEPMLSQASKSELKELNYFAEALKTDGVSLGIHCCSKLSIGQIRGLEVSFLNLDLSLYEEDSDLLDLFKELPNTFMPGVVPSNGKCDIEFFSYLKLAQKVCIITPACGMASFKEGQTTKVFQSLKAIQNKTVGES